MYASLLGLSKTIDMLLKRGANPQLTDSNEHTGLQILYSCLCIVSTEITNSCTNYVSIVAHQHQSHNLYNQLYPEVDIKEGRKSP